MNELSQDIGIELNKLNEHQIIKAFMEFTYDGNYSMALWRLPQHENINLIIDLSPVETSNIDLEELPEGFIFSYFDEKKDPLFIKADISFTTGAKELKIKPARHINKVDLLEELSSIVKKTGGINNPSQFHFHSGNQKDNMEEPDFSKDEYLSLISQAIEKINNGNFKKIVPARKKTIDLQSGFDLIENFERLCDAYPNAFISMVTVPKVGTWIGATPELLIKTDKDNFFTTVSLAGTQPLRTDIPSHEVSWTQKEIEEQAMVSRYIINCFKTIRLREFEEDGPKTAAAGNLMHLKTEFTVDMEATNFLNLGSVMLKLLHPTSAVCGMPKESAHQFLIDHERFDREFFAGYLGPVNFNNESHIYVNLRCMQLKKKHGDLYAGSGVTAFSNPEKEWEETELKFRTLLNVIR